MKMNKWLVVSVVLIVVCMTLVTLLIIGGNRECGVDTRAQVCDIKEDESVEVCTYGRYGIEYSQEEYDSFEWGVYVNIAEITDADNNLWGYQQNTLRINEKTNRYVLDIYEGSGGGYYDEGTYTVDDDIVTLNSDNEHTTQNYDLQFRRMEDATRVWYVFIGDTDGGVSPSNGDIYVFEWME